MTLDNKGGGGLPPDLIHYLLVSLIINIELFFVFQGEDIGRWIIMGIFAKSQRAVPETYLSPGGSYYLYAYDKSCIIDRREEVRRDRAPQELGGRGDIG